jgi:hypothetical protein
VPRGALSWDEEAAARIVAQHTGGTYRARDVLGAEERTHDLDIDLPDGGRIALEVTSAGDGQLESLQNAAFGRTWSAPTLAGNWWLVLPRDPRLRVKPLMAAVVPHLALLEKHGVEQIGSGSRPRQPPDGVHVDAAEAVRQIFALRVRVATRINPPAPGETAQVLVSLGDGVGSNIDIVNELVAARAEAKAAKLAAAEGDKRHLFVWIRGSQSGAELAMGTLPPPEVAPLLPDAIDVLWVASAAALWRLQPPREWESLPFSLAMLSPT